MKKTMQWYKNLERKEKELNRVTLTIANNVREHEDQGDKDLGDYTVWTSWIMYIAGCDQQTLQNAMKMYQYGGRKLRFAEVEEPVQEVEVPIQTVEVPVKPMKRARPHHYQYRAALLSQECRAELKNLDWIEETIQTVEILESVECDAYLDF